MTYKVIIYEESGKTVYSADLDNSCLLLAGIEAEDVFEAYHLEHPCEHCVHAFRVISGGLNKKEGV